jgi:hypothetical protein
VLVCAGLFAACEEETAPGPVPVDIEIVSGNGQYSKQGTQLEDPIVVQVTDSDGGPGVGVPVRFAIKSGGGSLSRTTADTNSKGETSVRWTLGPGLGTQEITIELAADGEVEVVAQATSAVFNCPEEDPTFARRFTPQFDLFLFTRASSVTVSGGAQRAGVVQLGLDTGQLEFDATSVVAFDETVIQAVVRDCAFAQSGEFYIAWTSTSSVREIAKVASNRVVTHFASLEGILGTEITGIEGAVLGGCDEFGPFTVGCRDTLTRYDDATYSGTLPDVANYDAVAYDATGNYLYFIGQTNRRLRRVPLDGYTQTGPTEEVTILEIDEAIGATGMVAHPDGSVYILVESDDTKSIVRVTSGGTKETVFDFFSRGAGDAAGIQDDLAFDPRGFLYTLDTLNNVILLYHISMDQLFELVPDGSTDANAASNGSARERVGLAILP